jgi:hypothetical protein
MLETIIIVLLILWLLGAFGNRVFSGFPSGGNLVHVLLVIVLILILVRYL